MRRTHAGHRSEIPLAKLRLDDKTVRAVKAPEKGNRIDYDVPPDSGRGEFVRGFAVRTTAAGRKTFLLVYVTRDGAERRHVVGDYGPHTVTTAREAARKLRTRVDAGGDPFADQKQSRADAEVKRKRSAATLEVLCDGYVAVLRQEGKPSARQVEANLYRHVRDPYPALWNGAASVATLDDFVKVTSRLTRAGKNRTAGKVRAYLRAAFATAIAARGDAAIAHHFEGFDITSNPIRDLAAVKGKKPAEDAVKKRALSLAELRAYWAAIRALPEPEGPLLQFHLLTGAQRLQQLSRLTTADHDSDLKAVTIWDTKGRRTEARRHIVPLVPDAETALANMITVDDEENRVRRGPFLFTVSNGKRAAVYHTAREKMLEVATALIKADKVGATFTPGELRKTVETRLAAVGVSKEIRAHLQSHGLGGVQDVHYDDHDYLDEKRAALLRLRGMLEPDSKVVPIEHKESGVSR